MTGFDPWNAVFLGAFAVYVGIRGYYEERTKGREPTFRGCDGVERVLLAGVGVGSLLLPTIYLTTSWLAWADVVRPAWFPWVGLVLLVAALGLFWRSHADLGANWSPTLEVRRGHELVTRGVYRAVRHPMYASIFLWNIGQGLVLANWLAGWVALGAFGLLYMVRVPREERMMRRTFGDAYVAYAARTGRLCPVSWFRRRPTKP